MSEQPGRRILSFFTVSSRLRTFVFTVAGLLILYTLFGFFAAPLIIKKTASSKIEEVLGRKTSIQKVRVNPYLLTCEISGFDIKQKSGDESLLSVDTAAVNLQISSVFRRALVIKQVDLVAPNISLTRKKDHTYNISDLIPAPEQAQEEHTGEDDKPFRFSVNNITVENAGITFADLPRSKEHKITDMSLSLPQISNFETYVDTFVQPGFHAVVNGTPLHLDGRTKPFANSLETRFGIKLSGIDLPFYMAYLPSGHNFTVDQGVLSTDLVMAYANPADDSPYLSLSGKVVLSDLKVSGIRSGEFTFIEIPETEVRVQTDNLLENRVRLADVTLKGPSASLHRKPDRGFRLPGFENADGPDESAAPQDGAGESSDGKPGEEGSGFDLVVDSFGLTEGALEFVDRSVEPSFTETVSGISVEVKNFGLRSQTPADVKTSFQTDSGTSAEVTGKFRASPLNVNAGFRVSGIMIPEFMPYYQQFLSARIDKGALDVSGSLSYEALDDRAGLDLEDVSVTLEDLALSDSDKENVLTLARLQVKNAGLALDDRSVKLGDITSENGLLQVRREQDGTLNLAGLLTEQEAESPEDKDLPEKRTDDDSAWRIRMNQTEIKEFGVAFTDRMLPDKPTFDTIGVELAAAGLDTKKDAEPGTVNFLVKVPEKGSISVKGGIRADPFDADFDVSAGEVALKTIQPYVNQYMDLLIAGGDLQADGSLQIKQKAADKGMDISFSGNLAVDRFGTVDVVYGNEFVSFDRLAFNGVKFKSAPLSCTVETIRSVKPSVSIIMSDSGSNISAMRKKTGKGETEEKESTDPEEKTPDTGGPDIAIQQIRIEKGTVKFTDKGVDSGVQMICSDLEGAVKGLATMGEEPADIDLTAVLNNQAPVSISGAFRPPGPDFFTDVKFTLNNMSMPDLAAYSGKYLGYAIDRGKLNIESDNRIEDKTLASRNKIFIDQLAFGEQVESQDASNLPVKLAVALLQDRSGEIRVSQDVNGDLGDPEFSVGGIVFQMVVNLITKAASSPFALIGSMFGSEDINHLEFVAGSDKLEERAVEKLETLAKAMYERPRLKLDISGIAYERIDRSAMEEHRFLNLLKTRKFEELLEKGRAVEKVEDVSITEEEYETYLWQAYKAAPFEKPRNLVGAVEKIEPSQQEKQLREFVRVDDRDLLSLARSRSLRVKDFLVQNGPVEPERLFITEPVLRQSGSESDGSSRQVQLEMK
ncbi:MAG: DUF748 domain-containing protein [Thermodesulfobacteriota bacterium]